MVLFVLPLVAVLVRYKYAIEILISCYSFLAGIFYCSLSWNQKAKESHPHTFEFNRDEENIVDNQLIDKSKSVVIEAGYASPAYLQRYLKIGYTKAARLMEILHEDGIIEEADGAKPRRITQDYKVTDFPKRFELLEKE